MSDLPQINESPARGRTQPLTHNDAVASISMDDALAQIEQGQVNRQVSAVILAKVPPERIAEAIAKLVGAKRTTKHGEEMDIRAVEAGVKLWLGYTCGLPIQRQQIITQHIETGPDLWETAKTNPHVREALRNQLAALDAADKSVEI